MCNVFVKGFAPVTSSMNLTKYSRLPCLSLPLVSNDKATGQKHPRILSNLLPMNEMFHVPTQATDTVLKNTINYLNVKNNNLTGENFCGG